MKLFDKEYGFKLTVGASAELAKACPEGDMNRLDEVLDGAYSGTIDGASKFLLALSRGYEQARAFEEIGYKPQPLTEELIAAMDFDQFAEALREAGAAFRRDGAPTVEAESAKKNGGADSTSH